MHVRKLRRAEILNFLRKLARGCEDGHMTQQPHDAYADLAPSVGDRLRIARERRAKLSQGEPLTF